MHTLLQQGADLNYMTVNANQEATRPLVFIIGDFCRGGVIKGFDVSSNALLQRLLTLSANFDAAVCAPLCSSCCGIYWYDHLKVELWGHYSLSDMLKLSGIVGFGEPASASSSCVRVITFSRSNEQSDWPGPLLYGVSTACSNKLLRTMRDMGEGGEPSEWLISGLGVISLRSKASHPSRQSKENHKFEHPTAVDRLIMDATGQSQRLNCFAEALRYMGKTDETISKWAAHEETTKRRESEGERQRWREWVFGSHAEIQTQTLLRRKRRRSDGSLDAEQEPRDFDVRSIAEDERACEASSTCTDVAVSGKCT